MVAAEHPVAPVHAPGPIRSYAGWAAWEDTTADGRRYVIRVRAPDGRVTARPERADVDDPDDPDPTALPFDLGPDAAGRPSIVVSVCDRVGEQCRIRIGRLPAMASRPVGETAQKGLPPQTPTLWRGRVAWTAGGDGGDSSVSMRFGAGQRPRTVRPWRGKVPRGQSEGYPTYRSLELRGGRLVSVIAWIDPKVGGNDAEVLGVDDVADGRNRTLKKLGAGEGGQWLLDPQFYDAHTVGWLATCVGDPSGCLGPKWGFVRHDLRTGVERVTPDHHSHRGWAPLDAETVVAGPDFCAGDVTPPWECVIKRRALGP